AEAFTFSAVYNAPVVFFCQNNQWAISEPTEKQSRVLLYQRARGFGFPGLRVDGNDVLATLAATRCALERARSGEGPTLLEAFTFSAVYIAPVVFFCQNNQWAISEPTEKQSRVPLYQRARGFGFPGLRVDGNDVLATLAATRWALERARSGEGPTLLEAFTYRMGAHTTSDDPTRYRHD